MEREAGCPRASCHPTGTPRRTWESFWTRSSCPGNPGPPGPEGLEDFETPGHSCWNPAPDSVGSRGSQGSASDGDRARRPRPYPPKSPRRAGLAGAWLPVSWRSVGPEGPGSAGWPDVPSFSWPWTGKPGPVFGTGHRSNPNRDGEVRGSPPHRNRQGRLQFGSEGDSRHHRGSRGFHSAPASDRGFRRNVYSRSRGPESSELLAVMPA